ncbi:hypothetical protein D3C76_951280 [compost metagenome]
MTGGQGKRGVWYRPAGAGILIIPVTWPGCRARRGLMPPGSAMNTGATAPVSFSLSETGTGNQPYLPFPADPASCRHTTSASGKSGERPGSAYYQ